VNSRNNWLLPVDEMAIKRVNDTWQVVMMMVTVTELWKALSRLNSERLTVVEVVAEEAPSTINVEEAEVEVEAAEVVEEDAVEGVEVEDAVEAAVVEAAVEGVVTIKSLAIIKKRSNSMRYHT
jgi:hypothetical protein